MVDRALKAKLCVRSLLVPNVSARHPRTLSPTSSYGVMCIATNTDFKNSVYISTFEGYLYFTGNDVFGNN